MTNFIKDNKKAIIKTIVVITAIVLVFLLLKKLFGLPVIKGSRNDYQDPNANGLGGVVSENVKQLVQDTNAEVNHFMWLCANQNDRCPLWARWYDLGDGDFITAIELYRNTYGVSLLEDFERVQCVGYCGSTKSLKNLIKRTKRLMNPIYP